MVCGDSSQDGIRSRRVGNATLFANPVGKFCWVSDAQSPCADDNQMNDSFATFGVVPNHALGELANSYVLERRRYVPASLDYIILVPTLRCNLACSYCQVSRASIAARGHDWSPETLAAVKKLVAGLEVPSVKLEFQGGEPTLRPDLILEVINSLPAHIEASFVICTNLQELNSDLIELFDRDDVSISTSLDGPLKIHSEQRQGDTHPAERFHDNLRFLLDRYGPSKISALPTINPISPPEPRMLIESYVSLGFHSIYLRPINFQGFARKRHSHSKEYDTSWMSYHRQFIAELIALNWTDRSVAVEETYFSLLLRRIFRPGENRHVDLRNPNPIGQDYIVIDHNGVVYPTDEARMLTRSGIIDLAIGDVWYGWDTPARAALNRAATLDGDPDCEACTYQAYCGRDIVDDISRYGRIDMPRQETDFCRRHLNLFDYAFELIHSDDEQVQYSLRRWLGLPGETGRLVPA